MAKPTAFTVALGGGNRINIYDAKSGNIYRIITLPGGEKAASSPVAFGDGFSVVVENGSGRWLKTYGFPLCNIKTITQVS